jgi:hypothetical protein
MIPKSILIAMLFALASSNVISDLNSAISVQDPNEGVLRCIAKVNPNIGNINDFCGVASPDSANCYNSYYALQLCLINNKCLETLDDYAVNIN